ncbi:TetR/AcrR family transcriptional regulator [Kitasatospora acidiphila]|uniref:TetR/AcrR family transcriptional regulator n=1 Tax=Kitasatospora acidiphila TaxID=2567942 RepID=A0A540WAI7_9ACTN|nr:TetR/AcrR family transcriptional regulator [Kitasatospora acidiphila]TQF05992.1 TetR/AcrR family transcriptional regulator [Kitasatospora acidiphila]
MSTPSPARERLLATATRLFYAEGIHAVGVDRIVTEAGVTRATFYRHFPSKEDLVRSYIQAWDAGVRAEAAAAMAGGLTGEQGLALLVSRLGQEMCGSGFRGCPFINAAAEYPDPAHPVAQAIVAHREWLLGVFEEWLRSAGVPEPQQRAGVLMLLRDGAMVGAALGEPQAVAERLAAGVTALVAGG